MVNRQSSAEVNSTSVWSTQTFRMNLGLSQPNSQTMLINDSPLVIMQCSLGCSLVKWAPSLSPLLFKSKLQASPSVYGCKARNTFHSSTLPTLKQQCMTNGLGSPPNTSSEEKFLNASLLPPMCQWKAMESTGKRSYGTNPSETSKNGLKQFSS